MTAETRTVARAVAALLAPVVLASAMAFDASHRRAVRALEQHAIDRVSRRLASPDLALSGGARWLRSLSLEEPGAAFAEGPAAPDPDPAGGIVAPPREAWMKEQRR